ncbi:MAG: hypothetical protein DRR04_13620, partial [Gammaproteobacteria bacterium]
MSFKYEAQLIEEKFNTAWGNTTPIEWDNVDYNPTAGTSYVKFTIVNGNSTIAGIGGSSNMHRIRGLISINVFTALNTGSRSGR